MRLHQGADVLIIDTNLYVYFRKRTCVFNQEVQALSQQPPIFTFISEENVRLHQVVQALTQHWPAATNLYVYFPKRTCVFTRKFRPAPSSHQFISVGERASSPGGPGPTQQPPIFKFISPGERASSPGGEGPLPAATNLCVYFRRRTCVFTRRSRPLPSSHQSLRLFPKEN